MSHARGVVRNRAAIGAAPILRAIPNATWGLHLTDANIALGNLIGMVRHEIKRYLARR